MTALEYRMNEGGENNRGGGWKWLRMIIIRGCSNILFSIIRSLLKINKRGLGKFFRN